MLLISSRDGDLIFLSLSLFRALFRSFSLCAAQSVGNCVRERATFLSWHKNYLCSSIVSERVHYFAFDFCPDTDEVFKINEDIQTVAKQVIS